jgi:hypothetical protein
MRLRRVLLPLVVLGLAGTSASVPAFAAARPKPVCHLITDGTGDGTSHSVGVISSSALDITSGDVATGKKTVALVLRVVTTNVANDPWAHLGYSWSMKFEVLGTSYAVIRRLTTNTDGSVTYKDSLTIGTTTTDLPAGSSTKMDATSYTWVIPRSAVPGLKKAKQQLVDLQAGSVVFGGNADQASSAAKYPDLYPSCVKAA